MNDNIKFSPPEIRIKEFLKSFESNEIKRVLSIFEDMVQFLKSFESNEIKKILSLSGNSFQFLKSFEINEIKRILSESEPYEEKLYLKILMNCQEVKEGLFMAGNLIYSYDRRHSWMEKVALHKNYKGDGYNYYKNMLIPFDRLRKGDYRKYSFAFKFINSSRWECGGDNKVEFDEEEGFIKKYHCNDLIGEVKVNHLTDNLWILVIKYNHEASFCDEKDNQLITIDWKDEYVCN